MALNEMTDKRYYGKVCSRHPEFNGLRLKRGYECVQCRSDKRNGVSRETLTEEQVMVKEISRLKHGIDTMTAHHMKIIAEYEDKKSRSMNELSQAHERLEEYLNRQAGALTHST